MAMRRRVWKNVPRRGFSLLLGIMFMALWAAGAEAGAARPAAGQAGGPPPASLQRKMEQLQTSVHKLQEGGRDLSPVVQIMQEFQPLMQADQFKEAEAVLDRTLARVSELGSPAQAAPPASLQRKREEQPAATAADAKPLACPAAGAAIDLASGDWALHSNCSVVGLSLRGDAQLWVEGWALTVKGNIHLEQTAGLHVHGGSFTVANQYKLEYGIEAKGNALLDLRDTKVSTNAGSPKIALPIIVFSASAARLQRPIARARAGWPG